MTAALAVVLSIFSVLVPQKMWFTPAQPINVTIKSDQDVTLVLTDFSGKIIAPKDSADAAAGKTVDVKSLFPDTANPGTYVLYAVVKGTPVATAAPKDFLGTPLVIEVLKGGMAGQTMVTRVDALRYAKMTTSEGEITMIFYYDVAPHTVDSFLRLATEGYYDGIKFHRVIADFMIQAGDPLGTGEGGPGFHIDAEFNARPHLPGALSMARVGGQPNSGGGQFFICLNYAKTKSLDKQYTVFGTVVDGFDTTVTKIAATPVKGDAPITPPSIDKVEVFSVTADKNPYHSIMSDEKPK